MDEISLKISIGDDFFLTYFKIRVIFTGIMDFIFINDEKFSKKETFGYENFKKKFYPD